MTDKTNKASAEETAYQSIISLIINQKYPPGAPLPETQISQEVGMSRTPVRSALRRLINDGFLESAFNKSARVPYLSSRDLKSLFDVRLLIEPRAAYEAAVNAQASDREEFDQLIARERQGYENGDPYLYQINEQIHFKIAALANNIYLEKAIKPVFWRSELYVFFFDSLYIGNDRRARLRDPEKSASHTAHRALIDAIFQNDAKAAEQIMTDHLLSTKKGLTTNANYR